MNAVHILHAAEELDCSRAAYSGDVDGRFQRDVDRHSGDVNKVGAQRRWDDNHAETFRINQGGARSLFSIIVSFPFLSLFRL
jgi:hypothetical protein